MSTTPGAILDSIAEREGVPRSQLIDTLNRAAGIAARQATGGAYDLEGSFDDLEGLRLYQCLRIVDALAPTKKTRSRQSPISDVGLIGFEGVFEVGEQADKADLANRTYGAAVDLARIVGLPAVEALPPALLELWPTVAAPRA